MSRAENSEPELEGEPSAPRPLENHRSALLLHIKFH